MSSRIQRTEGDPRPSLPRFRGLQPAPPPRRRPSLSARLPPHISLHTFLPPLLLVPHDAYEPSHWPQDEAPVLPELSEIEQHIREDRARVEGFMKAGPGSGGLAAHVKEIEEAVKDLEHGRLQLFVYTVLSQTQCRDLILTMIKGQAEADGDFGKQQSELFAHLQSRTAQLSESRTLPRRMATKYRLSLLFQFKNEVLRATLRTSILGQEEVNALAQEWNVPPPLVHVDNMVNWYPKKEEGVSKWHEQWQRNHPGRRM